ncbi:MAG: hypothetical protein Alpg2KO_09320 [Alphaproteobacteria bacterium]
MAHIIIQSKISGAKTQILSKRIQINMHFKLGSWHGRTCGMTYPLRMSWITGKANNHEAEYDD